VNRSTLLFPGNLLRVFGWDPRVTLANLRGLPAYLRDRRALRRGARLSGRGGEFPFGRALPLLTERFVESGTAKGHYFHQDLLIARRIREANPRRHVDVGSRVDGFVAHVAVFRQIDVFDIRTLDVQVPNIRFLQADMMKELPDHLAGCCDSLSCLHVLEHFGLGRYGDPVDFLGHEKALANLTRMLEPGGTLYLSVPIGPQRIEFNAHRVFSVETLLGLLEPGFEVDRFSFVDDSGDLHDDVNLDADAVSSSFGCQWGCGIVEAKKNG